jgi:lipopolysaccharide transport system permease protein
MSIRTNNSAGTPGQSPEDTQAASPSRTRPHEPAARPLPEEPVATIGPTRPWWSLELRELWHYRELLYFLTWRDVKVRYKQTLVGVAWVVVQPLLSTLIFTVFLGRLARIPSDGMPYPLFVFAGLLPWMFFAAAVTGGGNSLVSSSHLITKVYFPRLIIPAAAVCARLLDFLVSFVVFGALMLYYGAAPSWRLLTWLPALVALVTLLALGVGMWAAAVNVKYRDVGVALPVLVQFWMYASPVVYPSGIVYSPSVPRVWQHLYTLNPMVGIIDNFRAALLGGPANWAGLAASAAFTLTLLAYAAYVFRRAEKQFADII